MGTYEILVFIGFCILSYLLGGVSVARFITKKEAKGDINSQGSGNPGTMNMLRTHGIGLGLFTLLCDALKGALPALFGLLFFKNVCGDEKLGYLALYAFGLCAVIGHIFPLYYKFKGGKGIATTFGVFMVADPITSTILFGIMFLTLYIIKIGSVVSLLFITIVAIVQLFRDCMDNNWIAITLMLLIIVLDIYAHRKNLERLVENKENPADLHEGIKKDVQKLKKKKLSKSIAVEAEKDIVLETSNNGLEDVDIDKEKNKE